VVLSADKYPQERYNWSMWGSIYGV